MNEIEKVIICNPRHPEKAEQLAGNIKKQLKEEFISLYQGTTHYEEMLKKINIEFVSEASVQKACAEADIIITATNAREAVIQSEWIKTGTHLSCMGADMPVKQEIDEMLTARASLFADDIEQVTTVGECKIAYKKDMITKEQITEIGKVIAGEHPGRKSEEEITIFDSTGIAIQDLLTADTAIKTGREKNIGLEIEL